MRQLPNDAVLSDVLVVDGQVDEDGASLPVDPLVADQVVDQRRLPTVVEFDRQVGHVAAAAVRRHAPGVL